MASVLVTGGAGFIGTRLSTALLSAGHRVVVVDSLHPQVHPTGVWPVTLADGVERHQVDVTGAAGLDAVVDGLRPDVVVHLAAETGTGQSLTQATRHASVNVVGTTQLLDALTRAGHVPEHVLLPSSRAVYGEGRWMADETPFYPPARGRDQLAAGRWDPLHPLGPDRPVTPCAQDASTVEPRPTNVYAATKLAQEHLLSAWTAAKGTTLSVLRLQNVYGHGQSLANPYTGVLTFFASRALAGEAIDVYEDGLILRDFVHVDDVVTAMLLALGRGSTEPLVVDIGSGQPSSLLAVAQLVADRAGAPEPVVSGSYRLGDVRAAWADPTGARTALGFEPRTDFPSGVASLLEWVAEQTGVRA